MAGRILMLWDVLLGEVSMSAPGPVGGVLPAILAFNNLTAAVDPGASNDSTQGYAVGSVWFNNAAGAKRTWVCYSAAAGAAKWAFEGADFASGGSVPVGEVTQFGGGTGTFGAEGNLVRAISSAGIIPGSTGNDNVLATFTLPAGTFDAAGRGINIMACGSLLSNTNVKTLKLIFGATTAVVGSAVTGGTAIATAAFSTTTAAGGWQICANVFKYGAAASNTQIALHEVAQSGSIVTALTSPTLLTAVESGAILCAVTGNAATTAADIVYNFLEVNAMN